MTLAIPPQIFPKKLDSKQKETTKKHSVFKNFFILSADFLIALSDFLIALSDFLIALPDSLIAFTNHLILSVIFLIKAPLTSPPKEDTIRKRKASPMRYFIPYINKLNFRAVSSS